MISNVSFCGFQDTVSLLAGCGKDLRRVMQKTVVGAVRHHFFAICKKNLWIITSKRQGPGASKRPLAQRGLMWLLVKQLAFVKEKFQVGH